MVPQPLDTKSLPSPLSVPATGCRRFGKPCAAPSIPSRTGPSLHRPAPAWRGMWDAQLKHRKELPKPHPRCRWPELTQLGPGRHRHRRMPNTRGLFCPGESCRMRSSRCCILYPVLGGTVSAPSHSPGSTGPRPSTRACHRERASCGHRAGGWQQAEVRSGHSERLRAACAKGTFSGVSGVSGVSAGVGDSQRSPTAARSSWLRANPRRLRCSPALPCLWCLGLPGLQLHEGGCSSSATWQFSGNAVRKHSTTWEHRFCHPALQPPFAAAPQLLPLTGKLCGCLCKVPNPHSPAQSQHDPRMIFWGGSP